MKEEIRVIVQDPALNLMLKWIPDFNREALLFVLGENSALSSDSLPSNTTITVVHLDYRSFTSAQTLEGINNRFIDPAQNPLDTKFDHIFLRIVKSTQHSLALIAHALNCLTPKGTLWITGATDEGIKGLSSKLSRSGIETTVIATGSSCRILEVSKKTSLQVPDYHVIPSYYSFLQDELIVHTVPGIFSHGKIDLGTQLLLDYLPSCRKKNVLDVGTGSGILACAAAKNGAKRVVATDISATAITMATHNCAVYPQISVEPSNMADTITGNFEIILSNPPFHDGKKTITDMGTQWVHALLKKLTPRGEIFLVANSFLPYRKVAHVHDLHLDEIAQRSGFTLYRISRIEWSQKQQNDNNDEVLFDVSKQYSQTSSASFIASLNENLK